MLKIEQVLYDLNMSVRIDTVCHPVVSNRTVQKLSLVSIVCYKGS